MKEGFTLIEVLVAVAISGLLAIILMNTFFQVNRSTQLVADIADIQMRSSIAFHQIEKDMRGAYIPSSVLAALHTSEQKEDTKKEQQEVASKEEPDKKKELIPQVFVSTNKTDGILEQVTFITDNPLIVHWGEKVGKPHQYQARVTYRVQPEEPDENRPPSYRLVRYESADIAKIPDEQQTGIEVINNIKSITVTYRAREEETEEQKDEQETKPEKKQEKIEQRDTWDTDEQIASDKKDQQLNLPNLVLIDLALWTEDYEYAESFSYAVPIQIASAVIPAAIQKRKPIQKKEDKEKEKEKDKKDTPIEKPAVPFDKNPSTSSGRTDPLSISQ